MKNIFLKIVCVFGLITGCGKEKNEGKLNFVAERIKISDLKNILQRLKEGKTDFDFIGITSNGVDCVYFVKDADNFNIEFEAMAADQMPFMNSLEKFATTNNFKTIMTTYKNKTIDGSNSTAPVLRIITSSTLEETAVLGAKIQSEIFNNDKFTEYDVVP